MTTPVEIKKEWIAGKLRLICPRCAETNLFRQAADEVVCGTCATVNQVRPETAARLPQM